MVQLKDLTLERDQLRGKVQEQTDKVDQLNQAIQDCKSRERLLEQRAKQLEVRNTTETIETSRLLCLFTPLTWSA